ncbi:hypothetical protein EX895_005098 [Sporisorium graminicola]|uniref:Uncharacterized protein n=1 Tax=Sporisorium graminicola TaxID=280036 RepID=A0A4U7KPU9_9BASI|nr:hypothetical protein EX895_005098 [Sporisorium graminicola]TKY86273.1 hypothetical protein EX895_005098 [Sporisorium graminicola]
MWLRTALCWLGLLSTLLVRSAMDDANARGRYGSEYRPFAGFNFAQPDKFGADSSATGSGSAIRRPPPGSLVPSDAQFRTPASTLSRNLYGPGERFLTDTVVDGKRLRMVPQFIMEDHRPYGPYTVGLENFEVKRYPLDVNFLRGTYHLGNMPATSFEQYTSPDSSSFLKNIIYRPDPDVLRRITETVQAPEYFQGRKPQLVHPWDLNGPKQGEFLWPPVHPDETQLQLKMIHPNRQRMARAVMEAIALHGRNQRNVFSMVIPQVREQKKRFIMMVPVQSEFFTSPPHTSPNSDLWLFLETVQDSKNKMQPRMALLGASYLPKDATSFLVAHNIIRPAKLNILNYIHGISFHVR